MRTDTADKIIDIIKKNKKIRPNDLIDILEISPTAIHKQLKKLVGQGKIHKVGSPPIVFYELSEAAEKPEVVSLPEDIKQIIESSYLYVTPAGEFIEGASGFYTWVKKIKQLNKYEFLASEYAKTRTMADNFFGNDNFIDSTGKLDRTFKELFLDKVIISDFYALPKYGKTLLGNYLIYSKQAQNKKLIRQLAEQLKPEIEKIMKKFNIDAAGFIPHSIPRKTQFLKEFSGHIKLNLPVIEIVKAYSGRIPVAQKTLTKLEERIENSEKTIFIKERNIEYKNILLIDDAIGSGATLNETSKKLKLQYTGIKKIIGYAIVGSFKGFDVISEA